MLNLLVQVRCREFSPVLLYLNSLYTDQLEAGKCTVRCRVNAEPESLHLWKLLRDADARPWAALWWEEVKTKHGLLFPVESNISKWLYWVSTSPFLILNGSQVLDITDVHHLKMNGRLRSRICSTKSLFPIIIWMILSVEATNSSGSGPEKLWYSMRFQQKNPLLIGSFGTLHFWVILYLFLWDWEENMSF